MQPLVPKCTVLLASAAGAVVIAIGGLSLARDTQEVQPRELFNLTLLNNPFAFRLTKRGTFTLFLGILVYWLASPRLRFANCTFNEPPASHSTM
jgi:hypothetical protein